MKPNLEDYEKYNQFRDYKGVYRMTNDSLIYDKAGVCIYIEEEGGGRTICEHTVSHYHEYEMNKESDTFRIIVLGDSFTAGDHVEIDETFCSFLEETLNNQHDGYDFQVYNFGVSGYNTVQELIMLKENVLKYRPDLVILQYHDNDVFPTRMKLVNPVNGTRSFFLIDPDTGFIFYDNDVTPVSIPLPFEVNSFLIKHSYFYRFLSKSVYTIGKRFSEEEEEKRETGMRRSFESIGEMREITEKNGIRFFIIELPGVEIQPGNCAHEAILHEKLRNLTGELGIPYVDLCDYEEFRAPNNLELKNEYEPPESAHYSPRGYKFIAEILYENLKKHSLLP